jgi:ParB family transcriptional regulator, chromosome partitioning protein
MGRRCYTAGELKGKAARAQCFSVSHFFSFIWRGFPFYYGRMAKPVLGRGLGALFRGVEVPPKVAGKESQAPPPPPRGEDHQQVRLVPVARVHPSPLQPRKDFSADSIKELADSIKEQGIVQPLIVRASREGFELIAGERRWRAAQSLGLTEVPVLVREADDRSVLELALIENLQRENLNAIEEAQGYAHLVGLFQLTQDEAAAKVGKSRAVVANALRLLKLPPELQSHVREGRLSVGHAKVILGLASPEDQKIAAERVLKLSLNVRKTEELVTALQNRPGHHNGQKPPPLPPPRDAHLVSIQTKIQERFATKVSLRYHEGKGAVEIKFFSDDDLNRILKMAGVDLD